MYKKSEKLERMKSILEMEDERWETAYEKKEAGDDVKDEGLQCQSRRRRRTESTCVKIDE